MDVVAFQQTHKNHLGRQLKDDGDIGPETQWALDVASLAAPRQAIILAAQPFLGLVEDPPRSNTDPRGIITKWLQRCGANPGDPWCASSLSAWLSVVVPVKIPGAMNLGRHFLEVPSPFVCDIGFFPTDNKGHGHCFLIVGVSETEIMTYEGNCDNACRCVRRARTPNIRYSRPIIEMTGTCPGVVSTVPLMTMGGGTR